MCIFKDKTKDEAIEIILRHYSIACYDRIATLKEEYEVYDGLCGCDIDKEGCEHCGHWRDGIHNYQICLQDIKDFNNLYMKGE